MKVTYAIRYTGPGWNLGTIMYVTEMELGHGVKSRTGYGYCCGCKETLQFPDKQAGLDFCKRKGISLKNHEVIDSVTAKKEKDQAKCKTPPKSALTGIVLNNA